MLASSLQEGALVCQITHSWSAGLPCSMGFVAMCMFLSLCVCAHECSCPQRPKEGARITGCHYRKL